MSQQISIQDIVDEITQPNVVCVIDNEVPQHPEEQYLHIIYSLIHIVKQCVVKAMHTPYIHIKDVKGNFLFNERLNIVEDPINLIALDIASDCDIHLIKIKGTAIIYYCATTSNWLANTNRFYLNKINLTNGTIDELAYKKAGYTILNMVREGENIAKDVAIDTNVTVHSYDRDTKYWEIEFCMKKLW